MRGEGLLLVLCCVWSVSSFPSSRNGAVPHVSPLTERFLTTGRVKSTIVGKPHAPGAKTHSTEAPPPPPAAPAIATPNPDKLSMAAHDASRYNPNMEETIHKKVNELLTQSPTPEDLAPVTKQQEDQQARIEEQQREIEELRERNSALKSKLNHALHSAKSNDTTHKVAAKVEKSDFISGYNTGYQNGFKMGWSGANTDVKAKYDLDAKQVEAEEDKVVMALNNLIGTSQQDLTDPSSFLEKDEWQGPYNTDPAEAEAAETRVKDTENPGDCGNPMDLTGQVNCEGAVVEEEAVEPEEGNENDSEEEVMLDAVTKRRRPTLQVTNTDLPSEMSREEFMQYVIREAKTAGAHKGREMGKVAGYIKARADAEAQASETFHAQVASMAQLQSPQTIQDLSNFQLEGASSGHFLPTASNDDILREKEFASTAKDTFDAIGSVGRMASDVVNTITDSISEIAN